MKKYHLLVFMSILSLTGAFAQKGFHIGAVGSFNSTWILNQNNFSNLYPFQDSIVRTSELDYKLTWGWNGGVALGYNFNHMLGIETQVLLNGTGQKYEDNLQSPAFLNNDTFGSLNGSDRVKVSRQLKMMYVQIPIMFKFTSKKGRVAKFYGMLGPQLGFRITAKENLQLEGNEYTPQFTAAEKFKTFDIGLAMQLGTDIYATDHLYFNVGLSLYGGLMDSNSKKIKDYLESIDFFSQNDPEYQKQLHFRAGLIVGVHYIIGEGRR